MAPSKPLEKIAIIGATGHIGEVFVAALLKSGKQSITALTRAESKGILPEGVRRVVIDYDNQETLFAALEGQQFLIVTHAVTAPPDTQRSIVKAAATAGVPYIMPSFIGSDIRDPKPGEEAIGAAIKLQLAEIESLGVSYISLACGTWYEWRLALGKSWFGFTTPERKATFFDDGKIVSNVSTWSKFLAYQKRV